MQEIHDPTSGRRATPRRTVRLPDPSRDPRTLVQAYQAAVTRTIQQGLVVMQRQVLQLMRQVAREVWSAAGPQADESLKDRIVASLARDDALKGLLTHSDERFQALSVRVERTETALKRLAGATRDVLRRTAASSEKMDRAVDASREQDRRMLQGMAEVARRINRATKPLTGGFGEAIERLEARLTEVTGHVSEMAAGQEDRLAEVTGYITEMGQRHDARVAELSSHLRAGRDGADEMHRRLQATIEGVSGDLAEAIDGLSQQVAQSFDDLWTEGESGAGLRGQLARLQDGIQSAADRQEALLDETLGALRGAIQDLSGALERRGTPSNGGGLHQTASAFSRRLRTAEARLARLTRELDPEAREERVPG